MIWSIVRLRYINLQWINNKTPFQYFLQGPFKNKQMTDHWPRRFPFLSIFCLFRFMNVTPDQLLLNELLRSTHLYLPCKAILNIGHHIQFEILLSSLIGPFPIKTCQLVKSCYSWPENWRKKNICLITTSIRFCWRSVPVIPLSIRFWYALTLLHDRTKSHYLISNGRHNWLYVNAAAMK